MRNGFHLLQRTVAALFIILGCASAGMATANPQADARGWLIAARHAMSELNYRGIISYVKDAKLESLQIVHGVIDGKEYERLLSVNTPVREIVRDPEKVTSYYPDARSMSVDYKPAQHSFLLVLPDDLSIRNENYSINLGGTETIAQRKARSVSILPMDDYRYGRRVWIDTESKLPLKFEVLDEDGRSLEEMLFNSISVEGSIPLEDFAPTTQHDANWTIKHHEALPASTLQWTFESVPAGFRMMAYTRLKRGPDHRTVDHILLGDGFSSVSVYIDLLANGVFTGHPRKIGAINSSTRKVGQYLITVMGEAPFKTIQSIANGIKRQDSPP